MKIWLDDIRPAPEGYKWCKSVRDTKSIIRYCEKEGIEIEVIDCDHDLGDYAKYGGDGISLLDYLISRDTFYPIKLHTANPVGRKNMERLIARYWVND